MLSDSFILEVLLLNLKHRVCCWQISQQSLVRLEEISLPSPTFPLSPRGLRTFPDFHLSSLRPGRSPSYPALTLPRVPHVLAPRWSFLTQHLTISHDLGSKPSDFSLMRCFSSLWKNNNNRVLLLVCQSFLGHTSRLLPPEYLEKFPPRNWLWNRAVSSPHVVFITQTTCINRSWDLLNKWSKCGVTVHNGTFKNDAREFPGGPTVRTRCFHWGSSSNSKILQAPWWRQSKRKNPCCWVPGRWSCISSLGSRRLPRTGTDLRTSARQGAEAPGSFPRPGSWARISPTPVPLWLQFLLHSYHCFQIM